jgi:hypothetical protein
MTVSVDSGKRSRPLFENSTRIDYHALMDDPFCEVPWNTPFLWQEANASLRRAIRRNRHRLAAPVRLAYEQRDRLMSIFPLMDTLCRQTCPACGDICCQRAWVWADFKDLLFLHLSGIPILERQLLGRRGEHCCYFGPGGCRLERLQRPFVCTRYFCPAQTRLLRRRPGEHERLSTALQNIKVGRQAMEDQFIQTMLARPGIRDTHRENCRPTRVIG